MSTISIQKFFNHYDFLYDSHGNEMTMGKSNTSIFTTRNQLAKLTCKVCKESFEDTRLNMKRCKNKDCKVNKYIDAKINEKIKAGGLYTEEEINELLEEADDPAPTPATPATKKKETKKKVTIANKDDEVTNYLIKELAKRSNKTAKEITEFLFPEHSIIYPTEDTDESDTEEELLEQPPLRRTRGIKSLVDVTLM